MKKLLTLSLALGFAAPAWAQVPYDPPTAVKAAPNVFLILDSTRTTLISGAACGAPCHYEGIAGSPGASSSNADLYIRGETRLSLARRVLTGGWGWNTTVSYAPSGGSADGFVRQDGIMDQYKVRWGVMYYDGLGARWVLNPTVDGPNKVAQKAVIDFGQPGWGENYGPAGLTITEQGPLNSYLPYFMTTKQASCNGALSAGYRCVPWYDANDPGGNNGARQARALRMLRDYLHGASDEPQWTPPAGGGIYSTITGPGVQAPNNSVSIYNDDANVLTSNPPDGCRRNFTIMLLDGHGSGPIPTPASSNFVGAWDNGDQGRRPYEIAADIYNMARNHAAWAAGPQIPEPNLRNQVFAIHFGSEQLAAANAIADAGFDGVVNGMPLAYEAAPGGAISDLSPLYAAFASIFQLILDGTYLGATPTITHQGDVRVVSTFQIQNCTQALPSQCNIGRIGFLERALDVNGDGLFNDGVSIDFSDVLRSRLWTDRKLYMSYGISTTGPQCGVRGGCAAGNRTAALSLINGGSFPGNGTTPGVSGNDYQFMMGDPSAEFSNSVARGDTRNSALLYFGTGGASVPLTNPYKLMDIANSRPVVVGAPTGIGEDFTRWGHFRDMLKRRHTANGGDNAWIPVKQRDEVVYIGGNDGVLHAFLSRRHNSVGPIPPGRTVNYDTSLGNCSYGTTSPYAQATQSNCLGLELWGYTPWLLRNYWGSIRGGHYFMVDGTPIISDVLFTKHNTAPPLPSGATKCTTDGAAACANQWEYRTVLLQCLGGGGPGCFALDVSNPYDPFILWERDLSTGSTTRQSSTSRPQIVRMRRYFAGVGIPYYAAVMGGGMGEASGFTPAGSFMAVGLEDGDKWVAPTLSTAPFAGAPSCLDANNDSFVDTCYIANEEGSIYKIRFANGDPSNISMGLFFDARARLASLGLAGSTTIRAYSRVVATFDKNRELRVFFGTGNFEDVQNTTESNYFFELLDPAPEDPPGTLAINGTHCGTGNGIIPLAAREKVIFDPIISNGTVLFTAFAPDPNPCLRGDGALYGISYDQCSPALDDDGNSATPPVQRRPFNDQGMPSGAVVNERSGAVSVAFDSGTVTENAATVRIPQNLPVTKLWWRLIR